MSENVKVGSGYIELGVDDTKLKDGLNKAKNDSTKSVRDMTSVLSRIKMNVDTQVMKLNMKQAEELATKLKSKLEQKIQMNADIGAIEKVRTALNTVESRVESIRRKKINVDTDSGGIAKLGILAGAMFSVASAFSFLKKAFDGGAQMESYQTTMKVMLGTTEEAQKRMSELIEFASQTPFEIPEVVQLGNQLQAVGRYSKETMKNLGDLASASGKPIEQVAGAFAKLASGQKGIAVDMFRDLLITTNDWIEATGKGVTKNGELLATTEEMLSALPKIMQSRNFSGMMEEQSKTAKGTLSNLNDAFGQFGAEIGAKMIPAVKGFASVMIPALQSAKGNVELIISTVKLAGLTFVSYQVAVNGATVAKKAFTIATNLATGAVHKMKLAFATNPFGVIALAVVALGTAIYELNEAFGDTLDNQKKWNEEAQKMNANEQAKTKTLIEQKSKTKDVAEQYEKLHESYLKTAEGSKEHKEKEEALHKILVEQQKLFPSVITSTYDYAKGLTQIKDSAKQAITDVATLTGKLNEQQKSLVKLKMGSANIDMSEASESLLEGLGLFGAHSENFGDFSSIVTRIRRGKDTLSQILPDVEKLFDKFASWSAKGGKDSQYNLEQANNLQKLIEAMKKKIELNKMLNEGQGIDANASSGGTPSETSAPIEPTEKSDTIKKQRMSAEREYQEAVAKMNSIKIQNEFDRENKLINDLLVAKLQGLDEEEQHELKSAKRTAEEVEDIRKTFDAKRDTAVLEASSKIEEVEDKRKKNLEKNLSEETQQAIEHAKMRKSLEKNVLDYFIKTYQIRADEYEKYLENQLEEELKIIEKRNKALKDGDKIDTTEFKKFRRKENKELSEDYKADKWKKENTELASIAEGTISSIEGTWSTLFDSMISKNMSFKEATVHLWRDLGNHIAQTILMITTKYLTLQAVKLGLTALDLGTGGFAGFLIKTLGGHNGGDFVGTSSGVMKMKAGGSFIVPNGYDNDSFPLMVESGERVTVTPASQVRSESLQGASSLRSEMRAVKDSVQALSMVMIQKDMNVNINANLDVLEFTKSHILPSIQSLTKGNIKV